MHSVPSTEQCTAFLVSLKPSAQRQEGRLDGDWGQDQNPRFQVAPAPLPCGQLDQTPLKEVAMDLGQLCLFAGDTAFWLVANDSDKDPLTYGISGSHAYFFSVNSSTGEVKLASPLDFEVKSGGVGKVWRGSGQGCPRARVLGAWLGSHTDSDLFSLQVQTLRTFKITISVNDNHNIPVS